MQAYSERDRDIDREETEIRSQISCAFRLPMLHIGSIQIYSENVKHEFGS